MKDLLIRQACEKPVAYNAEIDREYSLQDIEQMRRQDEQKQQPKEKKDERSNQ